MSRLTQQEIQLIERVIKRLEKPNLGCEFSWADPLMSIGVLNNHDPRIETVSRIYLDSWIIPALRELIKEKDRDIRMAIALVSP